MRIKIGKLEREVLQLEETVEGVDSWNLVQSQQYTPGML
jgi:hypothetical protein